MSYSFTVRGATVAEVKDLVKTEFDKVVSSQPLHETDREAAENAAGWMLSTSSDGDDDTDVLVNVSGSIWQPEGEPVKDVSVNISVSRAAKVLAEPEPEEAAESAEVDASAE